MLFHSLTDGGIKGSGKPRENSHNVQVVCVLTLDLTPGDSNSPAVPVKIPRRPSNALLSHCRPFCRRRMQSFLRNKRVF